MRRLVGISSKTQKAFIAVVAPVICLTSIHMAAAARIASLRRQQEQLENSALSNQRSAVGADPLLNSIEPAGSAEKLPAIQSNSVHPQLVTPAKPASATASHKRQIVISIADRKLAVLEDGKVVKTYPIAVGARHTPSPEGEFVIVNHARNPVYRHADKEVPPGKDNPLGTRWMGLSMKGYGIHGTNVQSSVGKAASHGCFRMRKDDVEELYTLVQVGDAVTVRRDRDAMIAQVFDAPANAPAMTLAKVEANAETQVAAAGVTTVDTTQQ
jgi:lipoprotein-anchoring transpeptidase ErfK/SrfK